MKQTRAMVEKPRAKECVTDSPLNFGLGGREERGDLSKEVSEHIVQLAAPKLIPCLIFTLHNFYASCLVSSRRN